jgi:hypothetical protein
VPQAAGRPDARWGNGRMVHSSPSDLHR